MSKGTTRRTVRIDDGLWEAARGTADERGENLSGVIRQALIKYINTTNPRRSEVISDEAVEAALEVSLRQLGLWGKDLPEDLVKARRDQLTKLLEAAAPHALAEAWDEGFDEGLSAGRGSRSEANPHRSQ